MILLIFRRFFICCVVVELVAVTAAPARADEIWVTPNYQQDLGGVGVANNVVWPVTPAGAVRLVWAIPQNLQTFQGAKLVLIPSASALTPAALVFQLCSAQSNQVVTAG